MHWVLGLFFPPGPLPLDYCLDLLRQPGQVRGIDRSMWGSDEGCCTPMVALPSLMRQMLFIIHPEFQWKVAEVRCELESLCELISVDLVNERPQVFQYSGVTRPEIIPKIAI